MVIFCCGVCKESVLRNVYGDGLCLICHTKYKRVPSVSKTVTNINMKQLRTAQVLSSSKFVKLVNNVLSDDSRYHRRTEVKNEKKPVG